MVRRHNEEQCQILDSPITAEEVKVTLFSINIKKALGPDGYTAGFFKETWEWTGEHLIDAVLKFQNGRMLRA